MTPISLQSSETLVSLTYIAAWAKRSWALERANFLPPLRPLVLAAARPAMVRSRISSASNSARAAKMPNTKRPLAVVVFILAPCPVSTLKPTLRLAKSCTVFTRCLRSLPSLSSFQTTSTSPERNALRQAASPVLGKYHIHKEYSPTLSDI